MIIITDKKNCTGCHACFNICPQHCITMESDREGFWYPVVDEKKCIQCGLCEKVCPVLHKELVQNEPKAYACMNKDEIIRLQSSSGGIFTLIAEHIIDKGGVVFGASFDKNFTVVHHHVDTKEKLSQLRGSKYVQSKIGDTYKQVKDFLIQGRMVLFSGTPCQIEGLKSYLRKPYQNLFCVDIICHGVPSPKVWQKYISYRENDVGSSIGKIFFRRKNEGWKRFSVSFLFKNNKEYIKTFDKDLYMQAFLKNICLRPSCYDCEFKTLHRKSDITLADFWGIQNVFPKMDDDKGTSLIFVNSNKGQIMLEKIKDYIICNEVDIHKAVSYNSSAIRSVQCNPKRDNFFHELDSYSFDQLVKKYCSDSLMLNIKKKVKSIIYVVLKKIGLLEVVKRILRKTRI